MTMLNLNPRFLHDFVVVHTILIQVDDFLETLTFALVVGSKVFDEYVGTEIMFCSFFRLLAIVSVDADAHGDYLGVPRFK